MSQRLQMPTFCPLGPASAPPASTMHGARGARQVWHPHNLATGPPDWLQMLPICRHSTKCWAVLPDPPAPCHPSSAAGHAGACTPPPLCPPTRICTLTPTPHPPKPSCPLPSLIRCRARRCLHPTYLFVQPHLHPTPTQTLLPPAIPHPLQGTPVLEPMLPDAVAVVCHPFQAECCVLGRGGMLQR